MRKLAASIAAKIAREAGDAFGQTLLDSKNTTATSQPPNATTAKPENSGPIRLAYCSSLMAAMGGKLPLAILGGAPELDFTMYRIGVEHGGLPELSAMPFREAFSRCSTPGPTGISNKAPFRRAAHHACLGAGSDQK
jgi:hypothetical protein